MIAGSDEARAECICPEDALSRLIAQYHTSILHLCCTILRDPMAAEDAAQETFLKAHRSLSGFRRESSEKTWLTSIALNVCRDMRKSAYWRRTERKVTPEELPIAAPEQDPEAFALGQAIAHLPEKYRNAILLYYYQDMTLQEAAQILKITPSTLSKRLARARALLKKELEVQL